jgi:hypothetical protein
VVRVGDQWNQMTSASGYASSSLIPVHFGMGNQSKVGEVEIRWPGGRVQHLHDPPMNRVLDVSEPDR